jgi:uncharacterized protein
MKKILILSDGKIAKHFIDRVILTHGNENIYYIVEMRAHKYENYNPARFKFFEFDPTSLHKISNVLKMEFVQVIIALKTAIDVEYSIKNIRSLKDQLSIVVLDQWDMRDDDPYTVYINSNELLASRLLDYLPNVPVIAQNVGLGEGEIMEILVPFGSSFVYRHVGVIAQKNWRIVGVYRNNKLILPNDNLMIQPNDLLLIVGDPAVLKSVYLSIKRELGQFPAPYGSNLYLIIDMAHEDLSRVKKLILRAIFTARQLQNHLVIKVINPNDLDLLRYIKSQKNENIEVDINYKEELISHLIEEDIKKYYVGLVLISKKSFESKILKKALYDGRVPILKLGNRPFSKLKEAVVILTPNRELEKISTTIFDVSSQMNFNLELINYLSEHQDEKKEVIDHYNNSSTIFSKSIKISEIEENPIRYLRKKSNFLYCLPFSKKMIEQSVFSIFSTDTESLYNRLDHYHQLFIPGEI